MTNTIPDVILHLKEILTEHPLDIKQSKTTNDGRTDSILSERNVIELLQECISEDELYIPPSRHWFDLCIIDKDLYYPVDIKITSMKSSDNASGLPSIIYALTNIEMKYDSYYDANSVIEYFNKKYICENVRDYYYLVINKTDSKDVLTSSIKNLKYITPNLSNLPFQINWEKNRELSHMTSEQTYSTIKAIYKNKKRQKDYWKSVFINTCQME